MNYGYVKVASAIPSVRVGDVAYNVEQIENLVIQAEGKGVEVIVFPELSLTGYTCQDLFRQQLLLDRVEQGVMRLMDFTRKLDIIAIVGAPVPVGNLLLNCAVVIQKGHVLGMVPKFYLPNYSEFYEKRWFASAQDLRDMELRYAGNVVNMTADVQLFRTADGVLFGIEICEDVWAPAPPSNKLTLAGADIVFNLSASDELIGKHDYLKSLLSQQSARTMTGYVYSSCGFGESTQDVVYGGNAMIYENGKLLAEAARFSLEPQMMMTQIDVEKLRSERRGNSTYVNAQRNVKFSLLDKQFGIRIIDAFSKEMEREFNLERTISPHPFIPAMEDMEVSCEEIFNIQVMGLVKRLVHTHAETAVIGISGGLDSTLALLVCVKAFDKLKRSRKGIVGVTMPGFGTTGRTYNNAMELMRSLGITVKEVSIVDAVTQHFEDINHDISVHDVTYENSQARERTQVLMDMANKLNGMVVGTGDLSELALGWATYNGDHMSMYGVNASVPKTLIRYLVNYVAQREVDDQSAQTLQDIIDTPISPELIPADEKGNIQQKTEDLVGPYELHDFFLYYFLRFGFSPKKIFMLAKNAFIENKSKRVKLGPNDPETYDEETIKKWLRVFVRRFFSQQFKRSCLPDGPKVGSVSLSPRGDWRMPSDAMAAMWMQDAENM
ncbi:MAG TPA: NAD(+) synthase [Candidatus Prevotella avicola]|uniref:Glutamine-dependent NAD(+) synthetase n=1 Tax=Candidatus Prevotella avicola TaxID=2838738 RepID=A0A9D2JUY1_9BACT|nr:NAD(+) synthase [Candidatus Prevotella avicola]